MLSVDGARSNTLVVRAYWHASTRDLCDASLSGIRGSAVLLQRSTDGNPCDMRRSSLGYRAGRMRRHSNKDQNYRLVGVITVYASYLLDHQRSLAVSWSTLMNSSGIQVRGVRETARIIASHNNPLKSR